MPMTTIAPSAVANRLDRSIPVVSASDGFLATLGKVIRENRCLFQTSGRTDNAGAF